MCLVSIYNPPFDASSYATQQPPAIIEIESRFKTGIPQHPSFGLLYIRAQIVGHIRMNGKSNQRTLLGLKYISSRWHQPALGMLARASFTGGLL
jgi:hypothetical protein